MALTLSARDTREIYQAAVCCSKESSSPRKAASAESAVHSTAQISELHEPNSPIAEFGTECDADSSRSSRQGSARPRSKRGRLVAVANTSASMLGCMRAGLRHVKRFQPSRKVQAPPSAELPEWKIGEPCREQTSESDVPDIAIEVLSVSQAVPATTGGTSQVPRTFSTGSRSDIAGIALEMPLPEAQGLSVRGKRRGCSGATSPLVAALNSSPSREKTPFATVKSSEGYGPGPVHDSLAQIKPHRTPALEGASAGRCAAARIAQAAAALGVPRAPSTQVVGTDVALSVYVLTGASVLNKVTELAGLGGAYHVGVEIFCLEWSFGWSPHGSGVHNVYAGCSEGGTFKERIVLGQTPCTPHEVIAILGDLREAWPGTSYNLIKRNCAHFCMEFARRLKVAEFPDWVNSLATLIDWLTQWIDGSAEDKEASKGGTPATQREALNSSEDEKPEAAAKQVLASELDWTEAQLYMLERAADAERARKQRTEKNRRRRWL